MCVGSGRGAARDGAVHAQQRAVGGRRAAPVPAGRRGLARAAAAARARRRGQKGCNLGAPRPQNIPNHLNNEKLVGSFGFKMTISIF